MIIKNLSRTSNGSALFKYIFRYVFQDEKTKSNAKGVSKSIGTERTYWQALRDAKVQFGKKDIKYLQSESIERALFNDVKAKCKDGNYKEYIQKYLMAQDVPLPHMRNKGFIITHNVKAYSLEGFMREFEKNEEGRIHKRSNQTSVHHTIISFSNKDSKHITDDMLRDIARQYILLRGENCKYAGTLHRDKSHLHLHIAQSATRTDGMSARISKKDFEDVKVKLQAYQMDKYPELVNSLPEHRKSKIIEKEKEGVKIFYKNERSSVKNNLLHIIGTIPQASASQLLDQLQEQGFSAYYRGGRLTGVQHEDGLKFRFTRLGVDIEKLQQLGALKEREGKTLKEIQDLRKGAVRERNIEPKKEREALNVSENEKQELNNVQDLRDSKIEVQEKETGERDYGNQVEQREVQNELADEMEPDYEEERGGGFEADEETTEGEI